MHMILLVHIHNESPNISFITKMYYHIKQHHSKPTSHTSINSIIYKLKPSIFINTFYVKTYRPSLEYEGTHQGFDHCPLYALIYIQCIYRWISIYK